MKLQPIFLGGLVAGTLDITAACTYSWIRANVTPVQVLHYIASGVLGRASYSGGAKTAILGLALHYVIALGAAAAFYLVSRKWLFLVEHPIVAGLLYGIPVYVVTNFIVLPLSRVAMGSPPLSVRLINLVILMFCIGLPIALIVRRYAR